MIKLFKTFIAKMKELWNVYGGIALSTLIAWVNGWNKMEMDRWASYLVLTLTCVSVLTFLKLVFFKKKSANVLDKGALQSQKSVKNLQTAINPMQVGEELGTTIIYTVKGGKIVMKKLKNFFKELWGNKFTLSNTLIVLFLATLTQVATYTEYLYKIQWFAENELVVKIASPIIALLWVFIDLFTTYTKYGFESLEALAKRKEEAKLKQLTKEQKSSLKATIKKLRDSLDIAKEKKKELHSLVANFETLMGVGYNLNATERDEYNSAVTQINNIDNTILNLETKIKDLEEKL